MLLYQDNLPLDCIQLSVQGPGVTIMLMTVDHALNNDINEKIHWFDLKQGLLAGLLLQHMVISL